MADHPLADANVARVAVDNHPLATGVAVSAQPPVAVSPPRRPNVDDANKSLDQLADDFLTLKSSPPIHLKPQPLPKGQVGILRLRTLVERRAWGDVLKLAQTLLHEANSSKHSNLEYVRVYKSLLFQTNESADSVVNGVSNKIQQETLEIMGLKCHALLKLRRYTELQTEVGQWKFLKQNDVHAEVIEWIPWGMHILAAQATDYAGENNPDVLSYLREDILDPSWMASLDGALANSYIRRGQWRLALGALDRMIDLVPKVVSAEIQSLLGTDHEALAKLWTKAYRVELLSREGRIFLQIGGLQEAKQLFAAAKTMWNTVDSNLDLPESIRKRNTQLQVIMESLLEINDGLMYFSENNYEQALQSFVSAADVLKMTGFESSYNKDEWLGPTIAGCQSTSSLYHEAVNNISLCNLYVCKMHEAVDILENLVREDPALFLTERAAFNLCTLYELGSDGAIATRKKRVLQLIAKRFFLHDIGPESFRVT